MIAVSQECQCKTNPESVRFVSALGNDMVMVRTCPHCGAEHNEEQKSKVVHIARAKTADTPQPVADYVAAMRYRMNRLEQEIADISQKKRELAQIRKALKAFGAQSHDGGR